MKIHYSLVALMLVLAGAAKQTSAQGPDPSELLYQTTFGEFGLPEATSRAWFNGFVGPAVDSAVDAGDPEADEVDSIVEEAEGIAVEGIEEDPNLLQENIAMITPEADIFEVDGEGVTVMLPFMRPTKEARQERLSARKAARGTRRSRGDGK
mmetsp:Transcript_8646/g.17527  ORF Transcript_8646/g.17527 Transcript_8646/m.17527 type:complete len:152 (+) Transcript_8646:140-595(+)